MIPLVSPLMRVYLFVVIPISVLVLIDVIDINTVFKPMIVCNSVFNFYYTVYYQPKYLAGIEEAIRNGHH